MEKNFIRNYLEDNGYLKDGYEHYACADEIANAMKSMQDYVLKLVADTLWSSEIDVHHVDANGLVHFITMGRHDYINYIKNKSNEEDV